MLQTRVQDERMFLFLWPIPLPIHQVLKTLALPLHVKQIPASEGRVVINDLGGGGGSAGGDGGLVKI